MDPYLKFEGAAILPAFGLSTTGATSMFLKQLVTQRGLPFEAKISSARKKLLQLVNIYLQQRYSSADAILADVLAEDCD